MVQPVQQSYDCKLRTLNLIASFEFFVAALKKKMKVLLDCQLPMDDIFAVIVITQPPPSRGCFILVICLSLAYTTVWSSELDTLLMRHEVNLTSYRIKSVSNSLDQTVYMVLDRFWSKMAQKSICQRNLKTCIMQIINEYLLQSCQKKPYELGIGQRQSLHFEKNFSSFQRNNCKRFFLLLRIIYFLVSFCFISCSFKIIPRQQKNIARGQQTKDSWKSVWSIEVKQ